MKGITIIDVCRDLEIEPEPHLTWPVGSAVRELFERKYGRLPEKELRAKTNGAGSHCLAVYPKRMWAEIARIIHLHNGEAQRQFDMFKGPKR